MSEDAAAEIVLGFYSELPQADRPVQSADALIERVKRMRKRERANPGRYYRGSYLEVKLPPHHAISARFAMLGRELDLWVKRYTAAAEIPALRDEVVREIREFQKRLRPGESSPFLEVRAWLKTRNKNLP